MVQVTSASVVKFGGDDAHAVEIVDYHYEG